MIASSNSTILSKIDHDYFTSPIHFGNNIQALEGATLNFRLILTSRKFQSRLTQTILWRPSYFIWKSVNNFREVKDFEAALTLDFAAIDNNREDMVE
jgi:hypothetical protein